MNQPPYSPYSLVHSSPQHQTPHRPPSSVSSSLCSPHGPSRGHGGSAELSPQRPANATDYIVDKAYAQYIERSFGFPAASELVQENHQHPPESAAAPDFISGLHIADPSGQWQPGSNHASHPGNVNQSRNLDSAGRIPTDGELPTYSPGFSGSPPSLWSPALTHGINQRGSYQQVTPQSPQHLPSPSSPLLQSTSMPPEFRSPGEGLYNNQVTSEHGSNEWFGLSERGVVVGGARGAVAEPDLSFMRDAPLEPLDRNQPATQFFGNGTELMRLLQHSNRDSGSLSPHMDMLRSLQQAGAGKLTSPRIQHGPIGPPSKKSIPDVSPMDSPVGGYVKSIDIAAGVKDEGGPLPLDLDADFLGPIWAGGLSSPRPSMSSRSMARPSITIPSLEMASTVLSPGISGRMPVGTPPSPLFTHFREDPITSFLDLGHVKIPPPSRVHDISALAQQQQSQQHHRNYMQQLSQQQEVAAHLESLELGEGRWGATSPVWGGGGGGGWENGRPGVVSNMQQGMDGYGPGGGGLLAGVHGMGTGGYHHRSLSQQQRGRDGGMFTSPVGVRDRGLDGKGGIFLSPRQHHRGGEVDPLLKGFGPTSPPRHHLPVRLDFGSPDRKVGPGFGMKEAAGGGMGRLTAELTGQRGAGGRKGGGPTSPATAGVRADSAAQTRRKWVPVDKQQQQQKDASDAASPKTPLVAEGLGAEAENGEKPKGKDDGGGSGQVTPKTPKEETPRGRRRIQQQEWRMKLPGTAPAQSSPATAPASTTSAPSAISASSQAVSGGGTWSMAAGTDEDAGKAQGGETAAENGVAAAAKAEKSLEGEVVTNPGGDPQAAPESSACEATSPKRGEGGDAGGVLPLSSQLERPGLLSPTRSYAVSVSLPVGELVRPTSPLTLGGGGSTTPEEGSASEVGSLSDKMEFSSETRDSDDERKRLSRSPVHVAASSMGSRDSRYRADIEEVTARFMTVYTLLVPTAEEEVRRRDFLNRLDALVAKQWPEANLFLYGSCANAFGVCNSDIDICLVVEDGDASKAELVTKMANILQAEGMKAVQALTHARVPIVKFSDPTTNIACDICANNMLAVTNTKLLHDYAQVDPRLRQLAFCVKHWAKRRQINETYRGTLSSYAYVIMCIFFLQQRKPPILPCLQEMKPPTYSVKIGDVQVSYFDKVEELQSFGAPNTETLGELITAFFEYWAFRHDYSGAVISIRSGGYLTKDQKDWTKRVGNERHLICIEDPFETSHDLGRVVDRRSIRVLREEFQRAARIMRHDQNPAATLFDPYLRGEHD